jgi:hypothetical protein
LQEDQIIGKVLEEKKKNKEEWLVEYLSKIRDGVYQRGNGGDGVDINLRYSDLIH